MAGGVHSAAYTGTVADFGPIPKPSMNRAMNRCHQVLVRPCQMHVMKDRNAEMKMVPRRPKRLFKGAESQHPTRPQQSLRQTASALRYYAKKALTYVRSAVNETEEPLVGNYVLRNTNLIREE